MCIMCGCVNVHYVWVCGCVSCVSVYHVWVCLTEPHSKQENTPSKVLRTLQIQGMCVCICVLHIRQFNLTHSHPHILTPSQSGSVNIRIVVMNNLLPSSIRLHEKYDLKGSTYKRKASPNELLKKSPTFKDLDFGERHEEVHNPHTLTPSQRTLLAHAHSFCVSRHTH